VSWFDSFDTYATGVTSLLTRYPASTNSGDVRISQYGRRGGKALVLTPSNVAIRTTLARGISTPLSGREPYVRIGMAVYLLGGDSLNGPNEFGQQLFTVRVSAQHRSSVHVTYYEIGGVIQAYNDDTTWSPAKVPDFEQVDGIVENFVYRKPAIVIGVGSDGFLRISRAARQQPSPDFYNADFLIARSTRQMPFNQWCHLEFSIFMGTDGDPDGFIYGWIDGELAMQVNAVSLAVEADYDNLFYVSQRFAGLLTGPRVASGSHLFNADNRGYCDFTIPPYGTASLAADSPTTYSRMDDLYILTDPTTPDQPLGDLIGYPLPVIADGASQDSIIGGTSPAATHWQSVATDDGDVTRVAFGDEDDTDYYEPDDLDAGLTVKAVMVRATMKKSDGGAAQMALGITNTDGALEANPTDVTSSTAYGEYNVTFEKDPLGVDWTPTTVNDAEISARRVL
jgi:hypothetical protein